MDCEKKMNSVVRKAESEDINNLLEICKKSFRKLERWQAPRFLTRDRWKKILSSSVAETWVCLVNNKIAGYVTLVMDIISFENERKQYDKNVIKKVLYKILCPKLMLKKLLKKIKLNQSNPVRVHCEKQNGNEPKNCYWIDSIAVNPENRRSGIATILVDKCKERAIQYNMDGIKLGVDSDNLTAQQFYKNYGFYCSSHGFDSEIFTFNIMKEKK